VFVLVLILLALVALRFAVTRRRLLRCERCQRRVPLHDVVYVPEPPCGLLLCLDCESRRS